ncbi:MAG: acyl carrier protein [Candidatus Omnitrophota bacterium]|nr:acyl carrier protein [Candidatus Omnitrophota bacterium]
MNNNINPEEIKKEIKQLISEIAEIPGEQIKDDSRFTEDLGIDSMMALEVVAGIEKKYKIVIPEAEIPTIRSLQNVYALVEKPIPPTRWKLVT